MKSQGSNKNLTSILTAARIWDLTIITNHTASAMTGEPSAADEPMGQSYNKPVFWNLFPATALTVIPSPPTTNRAGNQIE